MDNERVFRGLPAPRCCEITSRAPLTICNRPAPWTSPIVTTSVAPFWCGEHRKPNSVIALGAYLVRRVAFVGQIVLASVVDTDLLARAEALSRLDRGVRSVGGVLSAHVSASEIGLWTAQPASGDANGTKAGS